jgi:phosphate-selective porin OprO and OprP
MKTPRAAFAPAFAMVFLAACGAFAEQSATEKQEPAHEDGFLIRSSDGNILIRPHGFVQADAVGFGPDAAGTTTGYIRRARLGFDATLFGFASVKLETDLNGATLKDAYVAFNFGPAFNLRLGQFKVPLGLEELTADVSVPFVERSIVTETIVPGRDFGAMAYGKLFDGVVGYQVGIFNGNGDNTADTNNSKDVAGRLILKPLRHAGLLKGLQFGGAFEIGTQQTSFEDAHAAEAGPYVTPADTPFFSFAPGVVEQGARRRFTAELGLPVGPASLRAEFISLHADLAQGATTSALDAHGWYVTATWALTGEAAQVDKGITPNHPFHMGKEGWGAFELAGRISGLSIDSAAGVATGTSGELESTFGANWYPNALSAVRLDFERVSFRDPVPPAGDAETTLQLRFQVLF